MIESTIPDASAGYLDAQAIKDAFVMWIEDAQPNGDELVDFSMFIHKRIFEALGGLIHDLEDGDIVEDVDPVEFVSGEDTERAALAKIFKLMCKDLRNAPDNFGSRENLLASIDDASQDVFSSHPLVRNIARRELIRLIVLDELRYDHEN